MMVKYTSSDCITIIDGTIINAKQNIKGCCKVAAMESKTEGDMSCPKCSNDLHVSWKK